MSDKEILKKVQKIIRYIFIIILVISLGIGILIIINITKDLGICPRCLIGISGGLFTSILGLLVYDYVLSKKINV